MPSTNPVNIDLSQLEILDPVTSAKGGKMASIFYKGEGLVLFQPADLQVVFEPGTFSGEPASRVDLVVRPQPETRQALEELDDFIISYATEHGERLLGKRLPLAEVQGRYIPCLKHKDGFASTCKLKMNLEGKGPVRIWDAKGVRCKVPEQWRGLTISVLIRLKAIYVMGKTFGCILEALDVRCVTQPEEQLECPLRLTAY